MPRHMLIGPTRRGGGHGSATVGGSTKQKDEEETTMSSAFVPLPHWAVPAGDEDPLRAINSHLPPAYHEEIAADWRRALEDAAATGSTSPITAMLVRWRALAEHYASGAHAEAVSWWARYQRGEVDDSELVSIEEIQAQRESGGAAA